MDRDGVFVRLLKPGTLLLLAFLVALAWAPLPYGSNRMWAELYLGLGLGGVLVAWSAAALFGWSHVTALTRRLTIPALCILGALGWAVVQSLDLRAIAALTGFDFTAIGHPIWQMTESALRAPAGVYISVDPAATHQALFAGGVCVAAFMLAFELGRDRDRAQILLGGVIVIACLYAVAALASFYFAIDLQSWLMPDAKPSSNRMSGPFVNPNHFATFMSLGALAALGLFVETFRQLVVWDRGTRVWMRTTLHALTGPAALWLALIVVIVSALLLTQSRGGVGAFLLGLVALIVGLAVGQRRSAGEASGQRAMAALLVTVVGISAAVSADPLLGRVGQQGMDDSARASLAQSTINAIESAPLVGHGFGAFQRYYPAFADGSVRGDVDEAHNDLLETLADLGLPAGIAYIAAPVLLAGMCFAGCLRRRRDRVFPAIGFAASVVVGMHAFVEFSLQIPAIAVTYAALLGLGVAQSWRTNLDLVR